MGRFGKTARSFLQGQDHRPHVHDALAGDGKCAEGQQAAAFGQLEGAEPQRSEIIYLRLALAEDTVVFSATQRGIIRLRYLRLQPAAQEVQLDSRAGVRGGAGVVNDRFILADGGAFHVPSDPVIEVGPVLEGRAGRKSPAQMGLLSPPIGELVVSQW